MFNFLLAQTQAIPDYSSAVSTSAAGGIIAGMLVIELLVGAVVYVWLALCLQFIAKKTNTPNGWMAWVPIANMILMLQIAKMPLWYIILWFIPIVNIVIIIMVWVKIFEACGKPGWWVILMFLPLVNFIILGVVAFSKSSVATSAQSPTSGQVDRKSVV